MTPEEALAMPGAFKAFRYTNGESMMGEYAWIADYFECEDDSNDPWEVEEVVMVPVRVRVFPCHEVPEAEEDDD